VIRLLVTAGRGPAECRIAVANTLAAMAREAETSGLDLDVAAGPDPDGHGPASAIAVVSGDGAVLFAERWSGSIQWTAESPLRPRHKRKNWFIGVMALPEASPRYPPPLPRDGREAASLDLREVRFEAFRAGGPGGQHQNKTESAVRAVHAPSGLAAVARDGRSQHRNKMVAVERLAMLLRTSQEVAAIADQQAVYLNHDRLERGNPVRRFRGKAFEPL
jgi:peptide chain release factor